MFWGFFQLFHTIYEPTPLQKIMKMIIKTKPFKSENLQLKISPCFRLKISLNRAEKGYCKESDKNWHINEPSLVSSAEMLYKE